MEASDVRGVLEADWPELTSMLTELDADAVAGGLRYLEMSAITRFLADKVRAGDTARFDAFFDSVERCLHEGDEETVALVMVGLLEGMQNAIITELDNEVWVPYLKPTTRRAWQAVEDFWNGNVNAISHFSVQ